jgi:hypothetical protein
VESLGDSSIIRYIWEDYGLDYASGNPVSLFPIYSDAVEQVTDNQSSLSDAYTDYAIWRYFTGERHVPNQHFNESASYCAASTISDFESPLVLSSNKGASQFIELPSDDLSLVVLTDNADDIQLSHLRISQNNDIDINPLYPENGSFYFDISSEGTNVIVANSSYNDIESSDINFSISINDSDLIGDINGDFLINVQDVVLTVNLVLTNQYDIAADFNLDGNIDVLDVVQLINIILD